ncbi:MAG: hypothetical protein ACP5GX_05875 [Anaerolineae bacterium]
MNPTLRRILWAVFLFAAGVGIVRLTSPARVIIDWETASEVEAAGFLLYRSESPDGPFELVSENLIPAEGDPLVGASYEYVDDEVVWGEQYFYQLEEVDLGGGSSRYPEVVQAQAGLGWAWALGAGAFLTVVGLLADFLPGKREADEPSPEKLTDPTQETV